MSTAPLHAERHFTYGDYLQWDDSQRWELIDGTAYAMTLAPHSVHQTVVFELAGQLRNLLAGKPCRGYIAPIDVRLPKFNGSDEQVDTVVQPDLLVVCDPKKIDKRGVRGAPEFIIEVISPGSSRLDEIKKAALYEHHGVKEYWVVYADGHLVHIRLLGDNGKFEDKYVEAKGRVPITMLDGCEIDFDLVYQQLEGLLEE